MQSTQPVPQPSNATPAAAANPGGPGVLSTYSRGDHFHPVTPGVYDNAATATVAITNANQFYVGATVTILVAGTYLLSGVIGVQANSGGHVTARLKVGAVVVATAEVLIPGAAVQDVFFSLSRHGVVVAANAVLTIEAASDSAGTETIINTTAHNGAANTATNVGASQVA